jgi:hypothetical protein
MCDVIEMNSVVVGESNEIGVGTQYPNSTALLHSEINTKLLRIISDIKAEIHNVRSKLHIPLQNKNDYEYILNWCDMNYGNPDIRNDIEGLYMLIDMYQEILLCIWEPAK